MSDLPAPREGYVGFSLVGKDSQLWDRIYPNFILQIELLISKLGEEDPQTTWLHQQVKELGSLVLDHAKARLRKEGLENEQIEANIAKLYADREKSLAETRLINAQANGLELDNTIRALSLALRMTKVVVMAGEEGETLFIGRQIDAMLEALKAVSEMKSLVQEP